MLRLGIVDCDTSHVVAFTSRLHHQGVAEDQWVDGARVVAASPGTSMIREQAQVDAYAQQLREQFGVEIVARPADLIGKVDAVLIESVDGSVHYERALPFLEAGLPLFIDKPFTCSTAQARELVALARRRGVVLCSASSLRFAREVAAVKARRAELGAVVGAAAYSPASLHPRNPGLFHYGVHAVETLFSLLGPGCEVVQAVSTPGADVVVGRWGDGRLGTVRGTRQGAHSYGFIAFTEKQVLPTAIDARYIYPELLKAIVQAFSTGQAPVSGDELIEVVAFQEAALRSAERDGAPIRLAEL